MLKLFHKIFHKNKNLKFDSGNNINIPKNKNIKINIKGTGNTITIDKNITNDSKIKIKINGNNNNINIGGSKSMFGINLSIGFDGNVVNNTKFLFGTNNHTQPIQCVLEEDNTSITIGNNNLISWGLEIRNSDSHTILNHDGDIINKAESITIGNHVWIGHDCLILKNTSIPDECVVGTHTIVTKKFTEPNCLLVGIPAKIVKQNIQWQSPHPNIFNKK